MSTEDDFLRSILDFMADDPLTVYYTKYTAGVYDPATSEYTTIAVETPCQGLALDLTRNSNGLSSVYGKLILAGDKDLYLLPPNKLDPMASPLVIDTTSDRIRIGSVLYKVEDMKECNPDMTNPILYQFMLRR